MKIIKTQPKYRCDYCKKTGVKYSIEKHEKRCFRNPNRYCDYCENKGFIDGGHGNSAIEKCPYCSKFDKKIKLEIEERESNEKLY